MSWSAKHRRYCITKVNKPLQSFATILQIYGDTRSFLSPFTRYLAIDLVDQKDQHGNFFNRVELAFCRDITYVLHGSHVRQIHTVMNCVAPQIYRDSIYLAVICITSVYLYILGSKA